MRGSLTFMPRALTMQHSLSAVNKVAQYVVPRDASSSGCREKKKTQPRPLESEASLRSSRALCSVDAGLRGGFTGSYSNCRRAKAGLNPGQAGV